MTTTYVATSPAGDLFANVSVDPFPLMVAVRTDAGAPWRSFTWCSSRKLADMQVANAVARFGDDHVVTLIAIGYAFRDPQAVAARRAERDRRLGSPA